MTRKEYICTEISFSEEETTRITQADVAISSLLSYFDRSIEEFEVCFDDDNSHRYFSREEIELCDEILRNLRVCSKVVGEIERR